MAARFVTSSVESRPTLFGGTYGGGPFEYVQVCHDWLASDLEKDTYLTYEASTLGGR